MFDVLIAGGDVYDGSGAGPVPADVGVRGDRVAAVGRGLPREAGAVVDATGKAVCPGFINILSHSHLTILHDPRSLGELTQGVTTEVFGEGVSMGPLTPRLKAELERTGRGLDVEVSWTRLSEYLRHVERRGASQNVASFIGAGTLRAGVVGYRDRPATPAEFLRIVRGTGLRGEVFHLKASGRQNWHLMDGAISLIEQARSAGLPVTADVYPYTASSTGLTSIIPDRYHEGGAAALYDRLGDPEVRAAIRAELSASARWGDAAEAENVLILRVAAEENREWQGRTLAEVAVGRGTDPVETAIDLIASDRSRIQAAFFSISEENLRAALGRPWAGICSDSASMAPEGAFLDIVVFDPATVADRATFADPHQLSAGVSEVLVNGQVAISGGAFTGELAGRALAGPGARR